MWRRTKIDAGQWLAKARQKLASHSQQPLSEVQVLLGHVLAVPRSQVLAHPEANLTDYQIEVLDSLVERLSADEPLPYLLGRQEFFGLEFFVNPDVLIPRPETEQLVEEAQYWLVQHPTRRRAADVGTGSGCIAISLAYHMRDLQVTATDLSTAALDVAAHNVETFGLQNRVTLLEADLLTRVPGPFDLICANLPYIPTSTLTELAVTHYEPHRALDGGRQGLDLISRLLADAPHLLAPGGLILLEVEAGQGDTAPVLAKKAFPNASVALLKDFAGHPRLVKIDTSGEDKG